jgi:hypothetical protein
VTTPPATSPYQRVLGDDFGGLAPQLRERLAPPAPDSVGLSFGIVRAGSRSRLLRPVLRLLSSRRIAFAAFSTAARVSVTTVPGPGEGLSRGRAFHLSGAEYLIEDTLHVVDGQPHVFFGRSRALEIALRPTVTDGGLTLVSTGVWVHVGPVRVPVPALVTPRAIVTERVVDDAVRVEAHVTVPGLGEIFEYAGSLDHSWR